MPTPELSRSLPGIAVQTPSLPLFSTSSCVQVYAMGQRSSMRLCSPERIRLMQRPDYPPGTQPDPAMSSSGQANLAIVVAVIFVMGCWIGLCFR